MDDLSARSLTIRFGRGFSDDPNDPDPKDPDPPCPAWFTGQVPADPSHPGIDFGDGDDSAEDPTKLRIAFESHSAGKMMSTWGNDANGSPHASLSVAFKGADPDDPGTQCPPWASILCWKPIPLDYIGFYVGNVRYAGNYERDMALPSLTGTYDQENNQIILTEVEVSGEEGEPTKAKPSIRIMWPPGDLMKYINLERYLNPWYEIETRVRTKMPAGESLPPMWIQGPFIGGDPESGSSSLSNYALRVPVVFTWAEDEVPPGAPTGAVGIETYREFLTAEEAFKPQGDGQTVKVADPPEPGQDYNGPGVDLNEAGLNAWLANRGETADPLTANTYTLLMEIRPAWGRYTVKGKYLCHDNVMDLAGEYGLSRAPSIFLDYPLYKVPVAYLKMGTVDWIVVNYYWSNRAGEDLDTRTKLIEPIDGPDKYVGWNREQNYDGFIQWAGDNLEYGYESVLINAKLITEAFSAEDWSGSITVEARAYWYCKPSSKRVQVIIETYRGGTFSIQRHQWTPDSEAKQITSKDFEFTVDYKRCLAWSDVSDCSCEEGGDNPEWDTGPYGTTDGDLIGRFTIDATGNVSFSP